MIPLVGVFISMEVSSQGEYPGARECKEEWNATDACNGTKTAHCHKKLHVRMPTVKSESRKEFVMKDKPFFGAFCG